MCERCFRLVKVWGQRKGLRFSLLPCNPQWRMLLPLTGKYKHLKKIFHYEKLLFIFLVHGGTRTMKNLENWHRLELDIVIQWESIDLTCPRLWGYEFSPQHCKSRAKQKTTNNMKEEPLRPASGERFARCLKWVWALGYTWQQSCPLTSTHIHMHTNKCNKTIKNKAEPKPSK